MGGWANPTQNPYRFGGAWGYITDTPGSGLLQLGTRWYWPEVGRFIQQDPAGDGVNWYAYVDDNPVTGIDPEGLAYMVFDPKAGELRLYHDTGRGWGCWHAQTGRPGDDLLPITQGKYRADPRNISDVRDRNVGWWLRLKRSYRDQDSWGPTRLTLELTPDTDRRIRGQGRRQHLLGSPGGFFIHGGTHPGTAGCIRLSNPDVEGLFGILEGIGTPVGLTVLR
jgi:RHS repeat-associated protein